MPAPKYNWGPVDPLLIALYSRPRVVGELKTLAAQTGIPATTLNQRATELARRGTFVLSDSPTNRVLLRKRSIYQCVTCGKTFERVVSDTGAQWCSKACRAAAQTTRITGACSHCGRPIQIKAFRAHLTEHFCSRICSGVHRRTVARIVTACSHCGRELIPDHVNASGKYYCNRACQFAARRTAPRRPCLHCGTETTNTEYCGMACWSAAESVTVPCETCGILIKRWRSKRAAGKGKYCGRACYLHAIARSGVFPITTSGLERKVHRVLDARGITYQTNVQLYPYWPDLVFADVRLVVEIDGDYWHNLPGARERDQTRQAAIGAMGYYVLRIAEHEIKADIEGAVDRIAAELRRLRGEG